MTPEQYVSLLDEIAAAYDVSSIAKSHPNWYYGVCATRITPERPLVIGVNWGVAKDGHARPTADCFPTKALGDLMRDPAEMGSLYRLRPYLVRHVPVWEEAGQVNLYFFRTRTERELDTGDRALCEPIFHRLLAIARPSTIIAVSSAVRDWFLQQPGLLTDVRQLERRERGRAIAVVTAHYTIEGVAGRFVSVPHPMARMSTVARDMAWSVAFGKEV